MREGKWMREGGKEGGGEREKEESLWPQYTYQLGKCLD